MEYEKDFEDGFEYTSMGSIHFMHHPGSKEKLILIHGLGSSTKTWTKFVQFLPDDFDVFMIDLLGHGESDAPETKYNIELQFQALREFISMRNNGNSYIFGHSYGGWVVAYYASQKFACKGIILEDSTGTVEQFDEIKSSGKAEEFKKDMLQSVMKWNANKEYVFKSILDTNFIENELDKDALSNISVKTKILWGSEDKLSDRKFAQIFKDGIKGSTLDMIDGADHSPHYSKPEETAKLMLEFINSN